MSRARATVRLFGAGLILLLLGEVPPAGLDPERYAPDRFAGG